MAGEGMGDAYHKARRNTALFSGILLVWEYVGVRMGNQPATPVTAKIPVAGTTVTIENPQVIPVVIAVVVVYFSYRLAVEWYRAEPSLRVGRAALVDLIGAFVIAGAALLLFIVQAMTDIVLADLLTPKAYGIIFALGMSFILVVAIRVLQAPPPGTPPTFFSRLLNTPTKAVVTYLVIVWGPILVGLLLKLFLTDDFALGVDSSGLESEGADSVESRPNVVLTVLGFLIASILLWFIRKTVFLAQPQSGDQQDDD